MNNLKEMATDKYCKYCDETKLVTEFHKDNNKPDKMYRMCKVCSTKRDIDYRASMSPRLRNLADSRKHYKAQTMKLRKQVRRLQTVIKEMENG